MVMTESQKAFEAWFPTIALSKDEFDNYLNGITLKRFNSFVAGVEYGRKQALEDALAIVQNENKVGDMEFEIKELIK